MSTENFPYKVCAVNYLNTVPLVWGMLNGPQRSQVELTFAIPSVCAEHIETGKAQIGIVPVAEIARQELEVVSGYGIASAGAVRSILLVSRKPMRQIRTLAADLSSRTSVELARVILREMYGTQPEVFSRPPELHSMLAECDAALLIGDSALRIDPYRLPFEVLDLGAEWYALTGLPMVFALWAGKAPAASEPLEQIFHNSLVFGKRQIDQIVAAEHEQRGITRELADEYLNRYIHYEVGEREWRGLEAFTQLAGLRPIAGRLAEAR